MVNLADAGVAQLLALYRARQASPPEAVEACLRRIESVDPRVNAVLTLCAEAALESAQESSRRWAAGTARPLEGIPYGLKDVIATAGVVTSGGSGLYRNHVPRKDAAVTRVLRAAGGALVAKLHTFSFALGGPANRAFGPTRNPWDITRSSGGSSSGPAAAVAARMLPLAIGTDTGGSIRLPAAFCGVTGLRPTYGRVPRDGVMLLSWTLDTVGTLARSAADCARALATLDARGPEADTRDLRGVRIGVGEWVFEECDPEVAAAARTAVEVLVELGAECVTVELPHVHLADAIGRTIVTVEAASLHEQNLHRIDEYDDVLAERLLAGQFVKALDYARSLRLQRLVAGDFMAAFRRVDAVVTPTAVVAAPLLDGDSAQLGERSVAWRELATRATFPASLASLPAVSTPAGLNSRGLPIGLQIATAPSADELCLRIAAAFEAATPFAAAAPPLVAP